mgnify:CR=1 FL=1
MTDVVAHLGNEAEFLLGHTCTGIPMPQMTPIPTLIPAFLAAPTQRVSQASVLEGTRATPCSGLRRSPRASALKRVVATSAAAAFEELGSDPNT